MYLAASFPQESTTDIFLLYVNNCLTYHIFNSPE